MRLKTIQASSLKSVFDVLKDIINDVNFEFDSTGVHVSTLDTAKVTFINMFLHADNFEEYECKKKITAGMNILNTFKLLKTIGNNDTLEMVIDESMEHMDIIIENVQKKSITRFRMKLLDINEESFNMNDFSFDVTTILPSVNFQRIIRDMSNFSSTVEISRLENKLILRCAGDFVDQETEIECSDMVEKKYKNEYSLKYINVFTKATNICSTVSIQHHVDGAIAFKYSIANLGDISFYLAPNSEF